MKKKPNILIFMTDQQRGDSIMNPKYKMPNLNKLVENGVNFTNSYCTSPHCCPSRASFFSGEYPTKHGIWNNVLVGNALSHDLNKDVDLWSTHLKNAGYNMFFSGKWHVSYNQNPKNFGWEELWLSTGEKKNDVKPNWEDYQVQSRNNEWDNYKKIAKNETDERKPAETKRHGYPSHIQYGTHENPFNDEITVNTAIDKLEKLKNSDDPWCMYIGTLGPHDPYQPPQRFLDMYKGEEMEDHPSKDDLMLDKPGLYRRNRSYFDTLNDAEKKESLRHYRAFCTYEDDLFGRVMETLKDCKNLDDTLIVFLSDHGDYAGEHGLWTKGLPNFNSAYHIPLIMSWKNGIIDTNRNIEDFVAITDIFNTVLEVAGLPVDTKKEGRSLLPYLKNTPHKNARTEVYTQSNGNELYGIQRSVMTKDWKLSYNGFDEDELYDLKNDPHQMKNLAKDKSHQETRKELYKKLWNFAYENNEDAVNPYIFTGLAEYGPAQAFKK